MSDLELVTVREIAERLGYAVVTVRQWRHRGFPEPVARSAQRHLYVWGQVRAWHEAYERERATDRQHVRQDGLVTISEAAARLGISRAALYYHRSDSGTFPVPEASGRLRKGPPFPLFEFERVEAWWAERQQQIEARAMQRAGYARDGDPSITIALPPSILRTLAAEAARQHMSTSTLCANLLLAAAVTIDTLTARD